MISQAEYLGNYNFPNDNRKELLIIYDYKSK